MVRVAAKVRPALVRARVTTHGGRHFGDEPGSGCEGSLGCAGTFASSSQYAYFAGAEQIDAWSPKIGEWQIRARVLSPWAPQGAPEDVLAMAEPLIIPFALPQPKGPKAAEMDALAARAGDVVADVAMASPTLSGIATSGLPRTQPAEPTPEVLFLETQLQQGDLRGKYVRFRAAQRRQMVRGFVDWIQLQSRSHFVSDGPADQWAILEETLSQDGDDCDGLELLVYHGLRDLGFRETEVFRSIVFRSSDLQHHMVTLWFEDPDDPWVIDPTGVMTETMTRMSELPGWIPLKLFTETREYSVRRASPSDSRARLLAANP